MIVLPYLSEFSVEISTRINHAIKNKFSHCNFFALFQTKASWIFFFHLKVKFQFSHVLVLFINLTAMVTMLFFGKTKGVFKVRMCEYLVVSTLTGKRIERDNDSAIKEHHLLCCHLSTFEDFSILVGNNNYFKMESHLIIRDYHLLNRNKQSLGHSYLIYRSA